MAGTEEVKLPRFSPSDHGPLIISLFILAGFVFNSIQLFWIIHQKVQIDQTIFGLLNIFEGTLFASVQQVVNYWLGSSIGSKKKTDILDRKTETP